MFNITNMFGMFCGVHAFNQPVWNWDVSKVTHIKEVSRSAPQPSIKTSPGGIYLRILHTWYGACGRGRGRGLEVEAEAKLTVLDMFHDEHAVQ